MPPAPSPAPHLIKMAYPDPVMFQNGSGRESRFYQQRRVTVGEYTGIHYTVRKKYTILWERIAKIPLAIYYVNAINCIGMANKNDLEEFLVYVTVV